MMKSGAVADSKQTFGENMGVRRLAMLSEKISKLLHFAANIGVIGGLVLVGLELKQNSDLLKTQLLYEESGRFISGEQALYGENAARVWAKSIEQPRELTLEEIRIVDAYLYTTVELWRATHMLAQLGLLDDEGDWQHRVKAEAPYFLGNEYGLAWWSVYREEAKMAAPELIALIDQVLQADPEFTVRYLMLPMERLKSKD
jgi:hypothetical protein